MSILINWLRNPRKPSDFSIGCSWGWCRIVCIFKEMMKIIEHLDGFINGNIKVAKTFWSLLKLETRMAGLSVYPLLIDLCMLLVVFMTIWLSTMVFLGYSVMKLFDNFYCASALIFLINFILLGLLRTSIKSNLRKMSFEKTREIDF